MASIEETKRMIEVMQAYVDGAEIEFCDNNGVCRSAHGNPSWIWEDFDYRVKIKTKKIKLFAWFNGETLVWMKNTQSPGYKWVRVESEDKEIEVEE